MAVLHGFSWGRKSKPSIEGLAFECGKATGWQAKWLPAVAMSRGLMKDRREGRHVEEGKSEQHEEVAVLALPIVGREDEGFIGGWRSGAQT